jgi:antitoxin YefM
MAITASDARKHLFPLIEQVNDDQEPVEIVSRKGRAFLVSEAQFRSLTETAHLLRSPANAERLLRSIEQVETGGGQPRDLIEPDALPNALEPPVHALIELLVQRQPELGSAPLDVGAIPDWAKLSDALAQLQPLKGLSRGELDAIITALRDQVESGHPTA